MVVCRLGLWETLFTAVSHSKNLTPSMHTHTSPPETSPAQVRSSRIMGNHSCGPSHLFISERLKNIPDSALFVSSFCVHTHVHTRLRPSLKRCTLDYHNHLSVTIRKNTDYLGKEQFLFFSDWQLSLRQLPKQFLNKLKLDLNTDNFLFTTYRSTPTLPCYPLSIFYLLLLYFFMCWLWAFSFFHPAAESQWNVRTFEFTDGGD